MSSVVDGPQPPDRMEYAIQTAFHYGDTKRLMGMAEDRICAKLTAIIAVEELTSYELHTDCNHLPISCFCDPNVLISLMSRIGEPDREEQEEQWDGDVDSSNAVAHMNPVLRKDLLTIFKAATSSFTNIKSFADFMQIRIDVFGYRFAGCPESTIDSLRKQADKLTITESFQISDELLHNIQSFACFFPADLIYYLIEMCLKNESAIPAVINLLTNELKSCATGQAQDFDQNLLVTVLVQHLYFTRQPDVPRKIAHLVQSLLKKQEESADPVLHMEDIVSDLTAVYDYMNDMYLLTRSLILLIEAESGSSSSHEKWDRINILSLLRFFVDALLDTIADSDEKGHLLSTIDVIMRNHIRRKITEEEIHDVAIMYEHDVNRLPICYFQPYTECDLLLLISPESPDPIEILVLVAMLEHDENQEKADLHNVFQNVKYPAGDLKGLLPFMTISEWSRVYNFLIHFYEPMDMMCVITKTCNDLFLDAGDTMNKAAITSGLNHVFREDFECGASLEKLPLRLDYQSDGDRSSTDSDVEQEEFAMSARAQKYRTRRKFSYFKEASFIRQPYDENRLLHLLLTLESTLFPDPLHLTVRAMAADFMKVMMQPNEYGDVPLSPAHKYSSRAKSWFILTPDQRDFLMQLDPQLQDFEELKSPISKSPVQKSRNV